MTESAQYLQLIKENLGLRSDYALAEHLGISQPEANLLRRGRRIPNSELCIKMAQSLGRSPVELLLVAQKDKAPAHVKNYWASVLNTASALFNIPHYPRYFPRKIQAIRKELRQMKGQTLVFEGALAQTEAILLMEAADRSVDAVMERWHLWKRGESLYPNYLLANQGAVKRQVAIRRLLVLTKDQMLTESSLGDAVQVMEDQRNAGISLFFAFKEELSQSFTFHRLVEEYEKFGNADEINAALFDDEMLIFSRSYGKVPLGVMGPSQPITRINQLHVTWKPEELRNLNPAPLFELTRCVFPYQGIRSLKSQLARFKKRFLLS